MGIPGTETAENPRGMMVEVYWEQDDSGDLCISGHSTETPIPLGTNLASTSSSRNLGQGPVHGFVIDTNLLGNNYSNS